MLDSKSLTPVAIPANLEITRLQESDKPLRPTKTKHRFGGYNRDKKTGLYKHPEKQADLITFDYPDDGQGLRYDPLDGGNKDFIYRELKKGFSKFDNPKDAFSYKLSGKTWKPYRFDDVVKYAVGKTALMTEGEKDLESIRVNVGLVGVTFAGGMWSQDKINEACQMLKDAGLALLVYWGDDDTAGIYKANQVKYGCASVGLPCVVLNIKKFFPQLPEWQLDKDGELNGSGWGAADYFEHNKITPDEFIAIIEEQITEAAKQPLEPVAYPVKPGSKGNKKSSGSSSTSSKKSSNGDRTPEEKQARKNRISKREYLLRDFISDRAWLALVNGSPSGSRHEDYPHLCWELWESYNYLLALGIETEDKPEQLLNEWFKNSSLSSGDESYDKARDCFDNSVSKLPNDGKQKHIQILLEGKDTDSVRSGEVFEKLPIAPRNSELVLANPHAPHNRNSQSWSIFEGGDDPLVLVTGMENGEKIANHGYIVASLPDDKPTLKELKYGGFSWQAWEQLKPLLIYKDPKGKLRYTGRTIYVVLNGQNISQDDNFTRLLKLKKYHADVRVIEAGNEIFDSIEAFNTSFEKSLTYVQYKTRKMVRLDRKPDLLIPATQKHFPSTLIDIPSKFGILSGFCATGKTHQIKTRIRENNRQGILTIVFSKTITLKDQAKARLEIKTVEDVVKASMSNSAIALEAFSSCMDSVIKTRNLLKKHGYLDKNSPNYGKFEIIIDEVDETGSHYAVGTETHIAKFRPLAVEAFSELAIHCHKLIICDANICPIIVNYLEELTKSKAYLIQHGKTGKGRKITVWDGETPMEMVHLGLIKNLKECPSEAVSVQTLSCSYDSKWTPKNTEELLKEYTPDRKFSIADKNTTRDPNHENFNLLSERSNGETKLNRRMAELSRENAVFINNSVISTGTSIESIFEKDFIIAPAVGNPLGVFQKSLRVRYEEKESHIWLGHANYETTYIFNSEDPNEIKQSLNKRDEAVRLGFSEKGETIADIPYDQLFEDLKCRLAARENFFSRNFKEATIALFELWEFEIQTKQDYIDSHRFSDSWNYTEAEIADYEHNEDEKISEMYAIQESTINQELLAICSSKILDEFEFEEINNKHEKKTLEEERSITRTKFELEYEGSIECNLDEMKDYLDLKPQMLQNQFYFLNPELDHLRNIITLEKATSDNEGKRDRADILKKLSRMTGFDKLRELGFERFFYELYNIKGVTPFNNIPKIADGDFRWIKKVVTVSLEDGTTFDQIHIDLKNNDNWTNLCKLFVGLGNECRTLFGFTPGKNKFSILRTFLSKFFLDLCWNGQTGNSRSHFLRFDDNRDNYFQVLVNRHNLSIHDSDNPQYDLIHGLGEQHIKPVTSTGKTIAQAYQDDRIDIASNLLEAVRQSKILGAKPKPTPLFSTPQGRQLCIAEGQAERLKSEKRTNIPEAKKDIAMGDYSFYNGKIVKVVGICQIGIENMATEGFTLEDLRRRSEKAPKAKVSAANAADIANHINTRLIRYSDDREKLLKDVQTFLPELHGSVLRLVSALPV